MKCLAAVHGMKQFRHSCRHGRLCLLANRTFLTMTLHILCHVDPVCHISVGKGSSVHLDGLLEVSHDTAAMRSITGRTGTVTLSEVGPGV